MNKEHQRGGLNFETIASMVAMVVGLSALFVAWDQAQIMRKQQHASVIPIVNIVGGFTMEPDRNVLRVIVENDGIGPAIVESAALFVEGRAISDWPSLRASFLPEPLRSGYETSFESTIGVLAPGERLPAIEISWARTDETDAMFRAFQATVFQAAAAETNLVICYCSVFDRCWRTNVVGAARPRPVEQCDDAGEDVIARLLQTLD